MRRKPKLDWTLILRCARI